MVEAQPCATYALWLLLVISAYTRAAGGFEFYLDVPAVQLTLQQTSCLCLQLQVRVAVVELTLLCVACCCLCSCLQLQVYAAVVELLEVWFSMAPCLPCCVFLLLPLLLICRCVQQ
jgi:hypothetical protein